MANSSPEITDYQIDSSTGQAEDQIRQNEAAMKNIMATTKSGIDMKTTVAAAKAALNTVDAALQVSELASRA